MEIIARKRDKVKAPTSKLQAPEKLQLSITKAARAGRLKFGAWNISGAWMLVLGCFLVPGMVLGASLRIEITPKVSGEKLQPSSLRYQTSAGETYSITRV